VHFPAEGDVNVFAEDVLFASPSGVSAVVCAAASNGWLDWKTARGGNAERGEARGVKAWKAGGLRPRLCKNGYGCNRRRRLLATLCDSSHSMTVNWHVR